MLYAAFMLMVLVTFGAQCRGSKLHILLYLVTAVAIAMFLIADMTTPLGLSF
jgi:hypothetical protein